MRPWRASLIAVALLVPSAAPASGQSVTVTRAGGVLRVQAPNFHFLEGEVLARLRDGRSVRLDFELTVLAQPGGAAVANARQGFNLSFDLWEERFAVTRLGTPPRSVSHLEAGRAEAWCVDRMTLPLVDLAPLAQGAPFWIRLEYRVVDGESASSADSEATFTLLRLIELLSRRRADSVFGKSVEAGPFRLPG